MKAPLLLLFFVLAGCVTVQPCVCPTPAPKAEPPASGFVYDGAGIPAQTLPWSTTLEVVREPWYDIPTTPLVVVTPTRTPTATVGSPR